MSNALARTLLERLGLPAEQLDQLEQEDAGTASQQGLVLALRQHWPNRQSVTHAVREVLIALLLGSIDRRDANTILYGLQTLLAAVRAEGEPKSWPPSTTPPSAPAAILAAGTMTSTGAKATKRTNRRTAPDTANTRAATRAANNSGQRRRRSKARSR